MTISEEDSQKEIDCQNLEKLNKIHPFFISFDKRLESIAKGTKQRAVLAAGVQSRRNMPVK